MTIAELKIKYTESEISSIPGDDALRFAAFAPLFQNLSRAAAPVRRIACPRFEKERQDQSCGRAARNYAAVE